MYYLRACKVLSYVLSRWNLYCEKPKAWRGEVSFSGPHSLTVIELEPSTQDSEHLLFLPLEQKHGQQSLGVGYSQSSVSSWRLFPTHLVGDCLHGDLVSLFRLDLPSDKALLLVFDPARPLDVVGLVHGFDPLLFGRCQEGHGVHIIPTFTFISTGHGGWAEGGAGRSTRRGPGLPWVLWGKQEQFARTDAWAGANVPGEAGGCFSHVTLGVLMPLGLNNLE